MTVQSAPQENTTLFQVKRSKDYGLDKKTDAEVKTLAAKATQQERDEVTLSVAKFIEAAILKGFENLSEADPSKLSKEDAKKEAQSFYTQNKSHIQATAAQFTENIYAAKALAEEQGKSDITWAIANQSESFMQEAQKHFEEQLIAFGKTKGIDSPDGQPFVQVGSRGSGLIKDLKDSLKGKVKVTPPQPKQDSTKVTEKPKGEQSVDQSSYDKQVDPKNTNTEVQDGTETRELSETEKQEFLDEVKVINAIPNLMKNISAGNYSYLSSVAEGLENIDPKAKVSNKDIDEKLIADAQNFINDNIDKGSEKFNEALETKLKSQGENKDVYRNLVNTIVLNSAESAYDNKIFQVSRKLNQSQRDALIQPLVPDIQADKNGNAKQKTVQGQRIIAQALDKFAKAKEKDSSNKGIEKASDALASELKQDYADGKISKGDMIYFANTFVNTDENTNAENSDGQKSFLDRAKNGLKDFKIDEESAKSILTFTVLGAGALFAFGGGKAIKGILGAAFSLPQTFMGLYQMYSNFTTDMYVNEQKRKQAEEEASQKQTASATA